jgi:outer membrane receptor protein involved in Fe transport
MLRHSLGIASDRGADLQRISGYAYLNWSPIEQVRLVGGLSYDALDYPVNQRSSPVSNGETSRNKLLPKLGIEWLVTTNTLLKTAYAFARRCQLRAELSP